MEAARAGERRSFAVVASRGADARAASAAKAARKIRHMIEQSGRRIDAGNQFVVSAGRAWS